MPDYPDGMQLVQVAITVEGVVLQQTPQNNVAAGGIGSYAGVDETYQVVNQWTVANGKLGELKEISFTSTIFGKCLWKVEVGTKTFVEDLSLGAPLSLPFYDLQLAAGTVVTVFVKSTDGSSINANASIVAKEIG